MFIDGRQDDGTIRIERKISVEKNVKVRLSFYLYSENESFNDAAGVCAYIGLRDPEGEDDFLMGVLGGQMMQLAGRSTSIHAF